MHRNHAREVISEFCLVPRKISKRILSAIMRGQTMEPAFSEFVTLEEYDGLKLEYQSTQTMLERNGNGAVPRNLAFYHILEKRFEGYAWRSVKPGGKQPNQLLVEHSQPFKRGVRASLSSLLFGRIGFDKPGQGKAYNPHVYNVHSNNREELDTFLSLIGAAALNGEETSVLMNWYDNAKTNRSNTLVSPICPDYANENLGDGQFRFTFDGLSDGVGLSAQRLLQSLTKIHDFLDSEGIKFEHVAAIGDFESFSERNVERVSESQESFVRKLRESQKKLSMVANLTSTPLFVEAHGGKMVWQSAFHQNLKALLSGEFGNTLLDAAALSSICDARRPLINRWHGEISEDAIRDIVLYQGAEYATMGELISRSYANPLVIGSDHHRMAPFYWFENRIPFVYLKSNYMREE